MNRKRRHSVLLHRIVSYLFLLFLCWDIELNPGASDAILQKLFSGCQERKELTAIEQSHPESKSTMASLTACITNRESVIVKIDEIKGEVLQKKTCESQDMRIHSPEQK